MSGPEARDELGALLQRYDALEEKLAALQEEKQELRREITAGLQAAGFNEQAFEIGGRLVRCKLRRQTKVDYDESLLRERLKDRYRLILAPDPTRIRRHMDEVGPLLEPVLELVGKPSRELVRQRVTEGTVGVDEFAGAFVKSDTVGLVVSRKTSKEHARADEKAPY